MKYLILLAVVSCIASVSTAPLESENVQAEIDKADPRYVLSSSSHHIPDDDPLVSIFVDILHDGDGETDPEPYEAKETQPELKVEQSPKELRQKRILEVLNQSPSEDEIDQGRDNRIGKFVNIHVGIDNRGNGNGDGLVNLPV